MALSDHERNIKKIAREIASAPGNTGVYQLGGVARLVMHQALKDSAFRADLFRLVDVFPTLDDASTITSHAREYLDPRAPRWMSVGQSVASRTSLGRRVLARTTKSNILEMAHQFILGEEIPEIVSETQKLAKAGFYTTVDLLGEKVITEAESDRYLAHISEVHDHLCRAHTGSETFPAVSVSVKPSALSPLYSPLSRNLAIEEVLAKIAPLAKTAQDAGSLLYLDMEHYDTYELTIEVFEKLAMDPAFSELHLGLVLQAYLRQNEEVLTGLLERVAHAPNLLDDHGTPRLSIRLVKGAYWDTEFAEAAQESREPPVFTDKADTDLAYERCIGHLLAAADRIYPAFASHNIRTLAAVLATAKEMDRPATSYEFQMLYGMAEPISSTLRDRGARVRIYTPVGELLPGMSYLVRRLLENTSNSSFVRQRFGSKTSIDRLVAPPRPSALIPLPPEFPLGYRHDAPTEYRYRKVMEEQAAALRGVSHDLSRPRYLPVVIADSLEPLTDAFESVSPTTPDWTLATVSSATKADIDKAISTAKEVGASWGHTPVAKRAEILDKAAQYLRDNRSEIISIEILEAGKPWIEADNDVGEAIDFCHYYARQICALAQASRLDSPPGELNEIHYRPRGITVVIPPWNFPLAIPTGMVVAALAAGNTVMFKPAEQTPLTARYLVNALSWGGLPSGVLAYLPGPGEVGAALVRHPDVATIAFTGSRPVGTDIMSAATAYEPGQREFKRVIAEMGGKNAIIVDADADLDQAVPGVLYAAFGFSGQKCSACSRVIVHESIRKPFLDRLCAAARLLKVGDPRNPETTVGPVIDVEARDRIMRTIAEGSQVAEMVFQSEIEQLDGYFVPPTIFADPDRSSDLYRQEIFGPVLTVESASSLEDAIARANDTVYALTQGIFSRSPRAIAKAASQARAGNFYVNRAITGAIPGRHPFGGFGQSGVGYKAGGPSYLLQFLHETVVSENLLRQGFSPDIS